MHADDKLAEIIFLSIGIILMLYSSFKYYLRLCGWEKIEGKVVESEIVYKGDNNLCYQLLVSYCFEQSEVQIQLDGGFSGNHKWKVGDKVYLLCNKKNRSECELQDTWEKLWTPLIMSLFFLFVVIFSK